jgi:hypothetical protein
MMVVGLASIGHASAQRNCGTVEYQDLLNKRNPNGENILQFEEWLKDQIDNKRKTDPFRLLLVKEPLIQIPVVVHVVHNGEDYGIGSNITDEQIFSQIEVLNEDFRRLNSDADQTLPSFEAVAADTEIEFVMAKQDPEGLPTDGILRVQGTQTSWGFSTDTELKSLSYWPAEDYLNMWVTTLGGGLLGYAQLPVSNLPGLEDGSSNPLTDGVVMGYNYFGSVDKYPGANLESPWNLGRTTTHEIGHFLGLRHIWGDCGCTCDDYVNDTPIQQNSTNGCPATKASCDSEDMFQNYMDYTDDACMNIFTALQKERMRVILNTSPRRLSLQSSPGLNDPITSNVDLGIKEIIEPIRGICTPTLVPTIEIRNYGLDDINDAIIELRVNELLVETNSLILTLPQLETQTVVFSELPTPDFGTATFEFRIVEVNGIADENPTNDIVSSTVVVPMITDLPLIELFETYPDSWSIINEDDSIGWEHKQTPSWDADNQSMMINFFDYLTLGEVDRLISPQIDLSSATEVELLFDISYAYSEGFNNDELKIVVSTDCGQTFDMVIYDAKGESLATTDNTSLPFIPSDRSDWRRISINLNLFVGNDAFQIAFLAINGGGNNLYIDNVQIVGEGFTDVGIQSLSTPRYVFCIDNSPLKLTIENLGTTDVNDIEIQYIINGGNQISKTFTNLELKSGQITDLDLDPLTSGEQEYDLSFQIITTGDIDINNGNYIIKIFENCEEEVIPLREDFDDIENGGSNWIVYDKDNDDITWKKDTFTESAIVFANYQVPLRGLKDYLFSPVLDFTSVSKASLFFDLSYSTDSSPGELLRIKVSTDFGLTYSDVVYEKSGKELSITTSSTPWIPNTENDWVREFVELNDYVGEKIMLAFEATGMGANNLYLDNIEFYADDNPEPLTFVEKLRMYPNPAIGGRFNLTFNLQQKENVQIIIFDVVGNEVYRSEYPNTLNQTYPFDLTGNMDGIYLIKTNSPSLNKTSRIFINP